MKATQNAMKMKIANYFHSWFRTILGHKISPFFYNYMILPVEIVIKSLNFKARWHSYANGMEPVCIRTQRPRTK